MPVFKICLLLLHQLVSLSLPVVLVINGDTRAFHEAQVTIPLSWWCFGYRTIKQLAALVRFREMRVIQGV
jgi:hypothetical protein